MTNTVDFLYDARAGYSRELYDALFQYGIRPGMRVLDYACGFGVASEPLVSNRYQVTGVGENDETLAAARTRMPSATFTKVELDRLPFGANDFDAVISAQALHRFDRVIALGEMVRVLKPGGRIAVWWKYNMSDDATRSLSEASARALGSEPVSGGLTGGFREFYAAGLVNPTLRVLPWRVFIQVEKFLAIEAERIDVRQAFGARVPQYIAELRKRLQERFGSDDFMLPISYTQYLYLGTKQ